AETGHRVRIGRERIELPGLLESPDRFLGPSVNAGESPGPATRLDVAGLDLNRPGEKPLRVLPPPLSESDHALDVETLSGFSLQTGRGLERGLRRGIGFTGRPQADCGRQDTHVREADPGGPVRRIQGRRP